MPAHRRWLLLAVVAVGLGPPATTGEERLRTDLRGDPLPEGAVARLGTTRFRHGTAVKGIAFTPDGKQMVTADGHGGDAHVRFWEVATGRQLREVPIPRTHTRQAISPDLRLAAWEADSDVPPPRDDDKPIPPESVNVIDLWDLKAGKRLHRLQIPGREVQDFTFCEGGKGLVSWHLGGRVGLWDCRTGKELGRLRVPGEPSALACAPAGSVLAIGRGDDKRVDLVDVLRGRERGRSLKLDHDCSGLAFAPDGKSLAVWGGARVSVLDVATGKVMRGFDASPRRLAFSPDGKALAMAEDVSIRLWDLDSGRELRRLATVANDLEALAFTPDGKTLASGGYDCVVRLWDVGTGKEVSPAGGSWGRLQAVAFSPDGKVVGTGGDDGAVWLWESSTGRQVGALPGKHPSPDCLVFSADGRRVASVGGKGVLRIWDPVRRRLLWRARDEEPAWGAAFTPAGGVLLVPVENEIRFYEAATGKVVRRKKIDAFEVAASPDGRELAACGRKGLEVWEAATGSRLYHRGDVRSPQLAFTPDGRVLAARGPNIIWGLELATGEMRWKVLSRSGSLLAGNFAFSPDGRVIAVADLTDTVKLFRVDTGEEVCRLAGHRGPVRQVAFAADGRLASASFDTTALVWDVSGPLRRVRGKRAALTDRQLQAAWDALAGKDAEAAGRAIWRLVGAGDQAVGLLEKRMRPLPVADRGQVARWLRDLDSADFDRRQQATAELEKLDEQVEPELCGLLQGNASLEVRRRAERLLGRLRKDSPGRLRESRAVEVLEYLDTALARQLLDKLAKGPAKAARTREAKEALGRLTRRSGPVP